MVANRRRPPSSRQESEVSDDSDDSFLGVVKFNEVTLFNFACHPTVLGHGNRLISADLFGAAQKSAESATGAPCAFVQGAAGDLSTRFTRRKQSFAEVDRLGTLLAEAGVAVAAEAKESATSHGLDRIERTLELPGKLLPGPEQARQEVREGRRRLTALRGGGADAGTLRLAQKERRWSPTSGTRWSRPALVSSNLLIETSTYGRNLLVIHSENVPACGADRAC